jgi:hypothetical protein
MEKISLYKLAKYINNKEDLYEGAIRNTFYLPSMESTLVTEDYLVRVVKGIIWCPKFTDVRPLRFAKSPNKAILLKKLVDYAEIKNLNTSINNTLQIKS